jgi:DnaJ-class molecular chaperone
MNEQEFDTSKLAFVGVRKPCHTCDGSGSIVAKLFNPSSSSWSRVVQPCPTCRGYGYPDVYTEQAKVKPKQEKTDE